MTDVKPQKQFAENLKNLVPQLLAWVFNLLWLAKIFWQQHEFILPETGLDGYLIAVIFIAGLYFRRYSGFLPAFCLLSYEVHAQSALRIENLHILYIVSWLACTALVYREPARGCSLILYHAALSFDPGSAATMGTGMQVGFSAVPVTIMFIAVFARELWNNRLGFDADSRHFAAIFALGWLAVNHYRGPAADMTSQFIAFTASAVLFYTTFSMASNERERVRQVHAIAAGGVLVITAAILNQALESGSIAEFFSRRAYAGALHANHIASWCLAAIWALIAGSRDFANLHQRRLRFFVALFLVMIVLTGARLIIFIAAAGLILHFLTPRRSQQGTAASVPAAGEAPASRRWLAVGVIAVLALIAGARIFYQFDYLEMARNERIFIWKAALNQISQAPWVGHGILQFAMLPQTIADDAATWIYDWNYPHSHQGILELLLWGGIPLLLAVAWIWLKALRIWQSAGLLIGFLSVSATIFADFTWRTPAMIVMAVFFLLLPVKPAVRSQPAGSFLKMMVLLPLAVVVVWLMQLHTGHLSYDRALAALGKGQETWKTEINRAVAMLPFSSDVRMQRMLWTLSRDGIDDNLLGQLSAFRAGFSSFWPAMFIEARIKELQGDYQAAFELYTVSLKLESADLTGIRHAHATLLARRLNDERFSELLGNTLARGEWGAGILLNHPDDHEFYRKEATMLVGSFDPHNFFRAVKLAKMLKNLARNYIEISPPVWQRFDAMRPPEWLLDEALAARYQASYQTGSPATPTELTAISNELQQHGSACLRTLAWIQFQRGDRAGFAATWQKMLAGFNFRNKNYEELAGQFLFAREALQREAYPEALEMLQKLMMFDGNNPFIAEQAARCHLMMDQREAAVEYLDLARAWSRSARLDPFYREEPRNLLWPQGDQWVFLFEKMFRRHDPIAARYCEAHWKSFAGRLDGLLR